MSRPIFRTTASTAVAMVALVLSLARAQQPSPSTAGPVEKAPNGWNQSDWNTYREQCLQLGAKVAARRNMSPEQLKNLPLSAQDYEREHEALEGCMQQMSMVPLGTASPSTQAPGATVPPIPPPPPPPGASSLSPSTPSGPSLGVFSKRLAQQQQNPSAGGIPEKAPHGWNPSDWKTIRDHCLQLSTEVVARQHMTPDQLKSVQPFSMRELSDMDACQHMVEPPPAPAAPRTQRDILNSGGS